MNKSLVYTKNYKDKTQLLAEVEAHLILAHAGVRVPEILTVLVDPPRLTFRHLPILLSDPLIVRLEISDRNAIVDGLAQGVQALHNVGGVHTNLCPCTVGLSNANHIVLLDVTNVGLATTSRACPLGSPQFRAPNLSQIGSVILCPEIDLVAIAVLSHFILSGHLPWQEEFAFEATSSFSLLMHAAENKRADLYRSIWNVGTTTARCANILHNLSMARRVDVHSTAPVVAQDPRACDDFSNWAISLPYCNCDDFSDWIKGVFSTEIFGN